MKFRITATSSNNITKMLKRYPFLKDKVKIEQVTQTVNTMWGFVTNTYEKCFIEIATLEEFMELIEMLDNEIIILTDNEPTIEIYDDYRE